MNDLPPAWSPATFNAAAFASNDSLSKSTADRLYLPIGAASALTGVIPGLGTASKAVVLDASRNVTNMGFIGQSVAAGGDMLTLTTTATTARNTIRMISDTQSWEIGSRASAAANPNTFYIYNGAYRLIMQPNGDTALNARLSLSTSGSHLSLVNGGNSGLLEVDASNNLRLVRGFAMNLGSSGVNIANGSTATARYPIDLGNSAGDIQMCFSQNGSGPSYSIGANNTNMNYASANGHLFYRSTVGGSLGTLLATVASDGTFSATNNLISDKGWFVKQGGFSSSGRTGLGMAAHMANLTYGEVFCYDYSVSQQRDIRLGNTIYVNAQNQSVGIGTGTSLPIYPLNVTGNFTTSGPGAYGYLNTGGSGTGGATGSVPVSIYAQHRVWCSEVNAFSDARLKDGFRDISGDDALDFVTSVTPKSYHWRCDETKRTNYGYIAQDVLKHGRFPELVSTGPDADLKEEVDEDGFTSPAGHRFVVSYQNAVPILHKALQSQQQMIEANSDLIEELRREIDALKGVTHSESKKRTRRIKLV